MNSIAQVSFSNDDGLKMEVGYSGRVGVETRIMRTPNRTHFLRSMDGPMDIIDIQDDHQEYTSLTTHL
jgi:hypothetical protein